MENEKMPSMPGLKSEDESASVDVVDSPNENGPSSEGSSLDDKPVYDNFDNKVSNSVSIPPVSGKIEVRATRDGFFKQRRRNKGDKFAVSSFKELGLWMECIDPVMEKKRVEFFKEKKRKARS